jgi:hypothetical protein
MNKNKIKGAGIIFWVLCCILVFFSNTSFSQYKYSENCQQSYRAIFSLQFAEARRLIAKERNADPQNLIPVYLENYLDCLTLFINEEPSLYRYLKEKKSQRLSLLEKGNKNSPFYRFCLAQVHLQWAFARLKFSDHTLAAIEVRKAYNLLQDNEKQFPDFLLNKTSLGIVHVAFGLIPENYRWVSDFLGFSGSVDQGINEIRNMATYLGNDRLCVLYKPEAAFYLAFITLNLQQYKNESRKVLDILNIQEDQEVNNSPLMIFAKSSILMKTGNNDEAIKMLQGRHLSLNRFPFHYLDYLEGVARLNNLDFSAWNNFDVFVRSFKGRNYVISAHQRMAWIVFLKGDSLKYRQLVNNLRQNVAFQVDEDKQVIKEINASEYPNYYLLRARLLFDGGYYTRALSVLLNNPVNITAKTKKDLIEYSYRLGRIYHESGNITMALEYYEKTINNGKSDPYYFALASAWQMGLIYENLMDWKKAEASYHRCLTIDTHEYKSSLRQKAKAGLERVKWKLKPDSERS